MLEEFIRRFGVMGEKLDRALASQTRERASTPKPRKIVVGPAYWKADNRHIWDKGGYCWSHGYRVNPDHNSTT